MSLRPAIRVFAASFAATLVLTGCGRADETSSEAPPPYVEASRLTWTLVDGDEGAALVLLGEGDRQVLHLACLPDPARMQVIASDISVIGSEERLTLGVADEAFGFVADTMRGGPGVLAEATIEPQFLEYLSRTADISAIYGAQQVGPWPAPPEGQRLTFVQRCSGLS